MSEIFVFRFQYHQNVINVFPFAKMFLYFNILTLSPTLNLGAFPLFSLKNLCMCLVLHQQTSF